MKQHDVKQDEAFVKELDTMEEVQAALKAKGVEVSVEELLKMAQPQTEGELDEDALEDVAGGVTADQIRMLLARPGLSTDARWALERALRIGV